MADGVHVRDAPEESAYVAELDGRRVGVATYRRLPGRIVFRHTEVDASAEGRGVGAALVRTALDESVERGLTIVPLCPFVAAYVERHPQYLAHTAPPR